jgi:hypothetical protein
MRNTYTFILLLVLLVSCSFSLRLTKFSKANKQDSSKEELQTNTSSTKNAENSKPESQLKFGTRKPVGRALVGNGRGSKSSALY